MTGQVLFLDIATVTGWCVRYPVAGLRSTSGRYNFAVDPVATDTVCRRFSRIGVAFCDWLSDMIRDSGCQHVVIERTSGRYAGNDAARLLPGLNMLALTMAHANNCTVEEIAPNVWKADTVGHGRAEKPQIMAACRRLGENPTSQDEADALCMKIHWLRREGFAARTELLPVDLPIVVRPKRRRLRKGKLLI